MKTSVFISIKLQWYFIFLPRISCKIAENAKTCCRMYIFSARETYIALIMKIIL